LNIQRILLFGLIFLIGACGSSNTEFSDSEIFMIAISPSAAPITAAVELCSNQTLAENGQYRIEQVFPSQFSSQAHKLVIQIGQAPSDFAFSAQIASERFFLITHLSRSLQSINMNDVEKIFSGGYLNWADLENSEAIIDLWIPTQSDESRQFLENHILNGQALNSNAKLSIAPDHMRANVSENEDAIGILPGAWINSSVNSLALSEAMPLLASSTAEAQGAIREIIACLQNGLGQALIRDIYQP